MKTFVKLLKETCHEFSKDKAMRMAAALAYYTIFSVTPLLLIAIGIAARVLGAKGATEQIFEQLRGLLGDAGAVGIQTMVESANRPTGSIVAVLIGSVMLLFGASGVFAELQDSLNTIWKAPTPPSSGLWSLIKNRFLSFSMVFGIGFLLLVSLLISAGIAALGTILQGAVPGFETAAQLANFLISIVIIAVLFAMLFKLLPDTPIGWRDVWIGAFATSAMFTIGKFLLGLYLGRSAVVSSYGAAGSLIVVLSWVYYSSLILLFGAEFTEVYSRHHGTRKAG
ncbi:MAG: rane protein [Chthoniobacter sp.]|jgi:membrane protein|nr:rane protein [Chthoniobacter sp.]